MDALIEQRAHCPYCGEPIRLLIDRSVGDQQYVEDCFVCCQPIVVTVHEDADGALQVHTAAEND